MQSTWVTRAQENDLPSQAFRGERVGRVTYTNDGFDEDAPIGSQGVDAPQERLTMKVVGNNQPSVIVTYEAGSRVMWAKDGSDAAS